MTSRISPRKQGYTTAWDKARRMFLRANPLCVSCDSPANVVDHIIPHKGNMNLFWNQDNWQSLCYDCHNQKTAHEDGGSWGRAADTRPDWIPLPGCEVVLVCGPPGSGKSTYAESHATKDDVIIDLDVIASEITGEPRYQGPNVLNRAIRERNRRLAALSGKTNGKAFVIISAPTAKLRKWWQEKLNATLVFLDVPMDVCIDRIRKDESREHCIDKHIDVVYKWFDSDKSNRVKVKRGCDENGIPTDSLHPWREGGLNL